MLLDLLPACRKGVVLCDMSNNEVENSKLIEEFARAGRTGRRNALPDVFSSSHASCGTTELTAALQQLHTAAAGSASKGAAGQTASPVLFANGSASNGMPAQTSATDQDKK